MDKRKVLPLTLILGLNSSILGANEKLDLNIPTMDRYQIVETKDYNSSNLYNNENLSIGGNYDELDKSKDVWKMDKNMPNRNKQLIIRF